MNVVQILLLAVLGGYAVVKSKVIVISPGDSLQNYLCNGSLQSNTTLVLGTGEHRISSGPLGCFVSNVSNVMILGSNSGESSIRCQGDGQCMRISARGVQNLTIEQVNFIACGNESALSAIIFLELVNYVSLRHCTFRSNSPGYSVAAESSGNIEISNCTFQQSSELFSSDGSGAIRLDGSTDDTTISDCTFVENNNALLISISNSNGKIYISNCIFRNNTLASYLIRVTESRESIQISNCSFDNNTAPLISIESSGPIMITDSMFRHNVLTNVIYVHSSVSVQVDRLTTVVNITKCTFQYNIFNGILINLDDIGGDICFNHCIVDGNIGNATIFVDSIYKIMAGNTKLLNGSLTIINQLTGGLYITNSTFEKKGTSLTDGHGGFENIGAIVFFPGDRIFITNCTFTDIVLGLFNLISTNSTTAISITDSTFQNNTANFFASLNLVLKNYNNIILISHCTFQMNNGGALEIYDQAVFEVSSTITDCTFLNNNALYGGAVFIISKGTFLIANSTFANNSATVGAAVMIRNDRDLTVIQNSSYRLMSRLELVDVVVENNYCNSGRYDERGGAISFYGATVEITGSAHRGSQFISNGPQGAIQGVEGNLRVCGNVIFANNSGENGGAISLLNVQLYFHNSVISFVENRSSRFGGAIYINSEQKSFFIRGPSSGYMKRMQYCAIIKEDDGSVTYQSNHAQLAGHAIYATPLYNCYSQNVFINTSDAYQNAFNVTVDSNSSQIVSSPISVRICSFNDHNLSNYSAQHSMDMYPGGTLQMDVTTMDYMHILSPSAVYAQIEAIGTQGITLGAEQNVQWVGKECTTLKYQIYGPEMTSLKLLLSSYPGNAPNIIEVYLKPCVAGFVLLSNTCNCSSFLTTARVKCDTTNGTVSRTGSQWIGVYSDKNKSVPAIASVCPLNYCKDVIQISLAKPEDLCNGGRSGTLCGNCTDGKSVVFGSSECIVCSDVWLITILMYAILGALLVAVLFVLNLTVAQGTLYGLIFYANIIQVNATIFFNQSSPAVSPLQVIISLLNLDLGKSLCFYNGMDDATKTGLQFVFPAYLLTLTLTIIVICHYCLCRNTENRHCLDRLGYLVGQRAVGVLCTLIYLSYSKLLRTVIDIFAFSTIQFEDGSVRVWFYDGNIEYLHGKHVTLFVAAMVICILFLLPYTLALTFIPIIEHYSEHNKLFNYLHKMANRVKPMNDVYFAPFKGEWRFWLGARLWLVIVLYIISSFYSSDQPTLLLFIHTTTVMLFLLMQAQIQPFGKSIQKTGAHSRVQNIFNRFCNWLDLFYLLNYTILSLSVLYNMNKTQTGQKDIAVGVIVGLYSLLVVATVLYHVIVTILMVFNVYERIKEGIRNLVIPTQSQSQCISMDCPAETDKDFSCALREPLSEKL